MELRQGTQVERYTIQSLLGRGGMAVVYKAEHRKLGTLHALKLLTVNSKAIELRLLREGRVQAKLRHPNVVPVTDVVEIDGRNCLVMEYIMGPSLDLLLRKSKLDVEQVIALSFGIVAGVRAAHRAGLVHRDLKPANIMLQVTDDGIVPKVMDFGVAKVLSGDEEGMGSTRTGMTMGTPPYMAPEQVRDSKNVDHRCDIFAIGAILYEMATGHQAFPGDDILEIFTRVATGDYVAVRELEPNLPAPLVEAIEGRGGAVFVRCPVAAVVMGGGGGGGGGVAAACGVRLANGDVIRARRVVSAIGYRATEVLLAASAPAPARAPAPLATQQSAGFVMANIGLNGTARELGIDDATLWLQPADASNGFDALRGERAFFADPLGVPESQIPAGITFPSVKGRDGHVGEAGAPQATCVHHSCQILVPAEWGWFAAHAPVGGELPAGGSRHAPPHLAREGQAAYDALKLRWSARLLSLLHAHFPRTKGRVEFCDLSTPLTLEHYLRAVGGAGVGLDVTPQRFVDPAEMAELDARHPRVPGLWRAGQDYLMCGQVMAAASGIITALRMRGVADTARFAVRAVRLLLASRKAPAAGGGQSAKEHKSQ